MLTMVPRRLPRITLLENSTQTVPEDSQPGSPLEPQPLSTSTHRGQAGVSEACAVRHRHQASRHSCSPKALLISAPPKPPQDLPSQQTQPWKPKTASNASASTPSRDKSRGLVQARKDESAPLITYPAFRGAGLATSTHKGAILAQKWGDSLQLHTKA